MADVVGGDVRVLGIGEYHEVAGAPRVQSALRRFTREVLDSVGVRTSDLVVETWVEAGNCGEVERRVGGDVKRVTERPATTENEVVALIDRARSLGIRPRILTLQCDDYQQLLDGDGGVDFDRMLALVTRKLRDEAVAALGAGPATGDAPRDLVIVYGGALHNDLYPYESVAEFSYVPGVREAAGGHYVEIDLYVPEYIRGDALLSREPWYSQFERHAGPDHVLVFDRGPGSFIVVLRSGVAAPAP